MIEMTLEFAEFVYGNTGDIGTRPYRYLTVSMLTEDECMYVSGINIKMLPEQIFKSCGIKNCTRSEYPVLGKSRKLLCGSG